MVILIIILLALTSCGDAITTTNFSVDSKAAKQTVTIINNIDNSTLVVDSSNISNKHLVVNYNDTVELGIVEHEVDTIILNGKITINNVMLHEGIMYIPYDNIIKLENGCTWKNANGNKILNPIGFSVSVNNWKRSK